MIGETLILTTLGFLILILIGSLIRLAVYLFRDGYHLLGVICVVSIVFVVGAVLKIIGI